MLEQLTEWLTKSQLHSAFSDTTHLSTWLIIPISQSLHILCVSIVMICVGVLNLRLLGVAATRQSFADLTRQLVPWIWGAEIVLLLTGIAQTIAEPARELMNAEFRIKMVLLAITVGITAVYQRVAAKDPRFWELSPKRRRAAHALATFSLVLWFSIAALGRLIAYL